MGGRKGRAAACGRLWDPGPVQPAVDLGAHDVAVGRRVVEPAPQRGGQQPAGVLELSDLLIEGRKALAGDLLPLGRRGGSQDPVDLSRVRPMSCIMPMKTRRRSVPVRYRRCPDCRASAVSRPRCS
jgi:hypothetical protein